MPLLQGIWLAVLKCTHGAAAQSGFILLTKVLCEKLLKKGSGCTLLARKLLSSPCPCFWSLSRVPAHVPYWLSPDPLTWLFILDLHLSHHYRFVLQPLTCWLILITITKLVLLFFEICGTEALSVQSQPCTCLGSPLALGLLSLRELLALAAPWHLYM